MDRFCAFCCFLSTSGSARRRRWQEVARGNFKAGTTETALFERFIPLPALAAERPDSVQLELSGLGGRGVCHPGIHLAVSGLLEHPENILANDVN
ncbi:MAG: hypothetical protein PHC30_00275 [Lentisphaeria bacterium]|nr:hypothetical protein [Lentisphaeria bacterium]